MAQPDSDTWAAAGRRLLVKAIEEFAYEELLAPVPDMTGVRDVRDVTGVQGVTGVWNGPGVPSASSAPGAPDASSAPRAPSASSSPRSSSAPDASGAPDIRSAPGGTATEDSGPWAASARPGEPCDHRREPCDYRLDLGSGIHWTFRATRGTFATWHVEPESVRRHPSLPEGEGPEHLLLDARGVLGWDGPTTAEVLRELIATRRAEAVSLSRALSAADLADLGYLELEAHQDGHPCMLLNKGRLGFSASDTEAYAPESASPLRLVWAAVHRDLARYSGAPGLDAGRLLSEELDRSTRERFTAALTAQMGRRADTEYVWLPVHPFHWDEAVVPLFAPYLADGRIVRLGLGDDRYVPLQSIRTLANIDRPGRRNVKMPLMIRNTLVWRGLSTEPTAAAPDISAWLQRLRADDPFLRDEVRFHPLGEVASVAVRHPLYESVGDAPYRYHELLGAVWREPVSAVLRGGHDRPGTQGLERNGRVPGRETRSTANAAGDAGGTGGAGAPAATSPAPRPYGLEEDPQPGQGSGERARTMAALLTTGSDGRALVAELVARSGLPPRRWLERLFAALLPGLLHYLYRYGVAFCPHGENTVLLFDASDVPVGVALKDFAEDVNLLPRSEQDAHPEYEDLSERADRVLLRWPAHELAHSLLSAVFAGHFRFFAPLVARHLGVPEDDFWSLVRAEIDRYHARFPELADRFASFGLLAPAFDRVALNREQLLGGGFHDRAERDEGFDVVHGTVANPLVASARPPEEPQAHRSSEGHGASAGPHARRPSEEQAASEEHLPFGQGRASGEEQRTSPGHRTLDAHRTPGEPESPGRPPAGAIGPGSTDSGGTGSGGTGPGSGRAVGEPVVGTTAGRPQELPRDQPRGPAGRHAGDPVPAPIASAAAHAPAASTTIDRS